MTLCFFFIYTLLKRGKSLSAARAYVNIEVQRSTIFSADNISDFVWISGFRGAFRGTFVMLGVFEAQFRRHYM